MPVTAFDALTPQAQAEALRPVALAGAEAFGLDVARMELALHAFNTTFEVETTGGRRLALRVNTNSQSTPAHIRAQHAWQRAIAAQTPLRVPEPLRTTSGDDLAVVSNAALDRDVLVVAQTWLEGDDVGECDVAQATALGQVMAELHSHASGWSLPPGASLTTFDEPLFRDADALTPALERLPAAARQLVREARRRATHAFAAAFQSHDQIVVHADLHGGNLKWHNETLAVFDFDDAGISVPAVDLAVATFYLRRGGPEREEALRTAYTKVRPWPDLGEAAFEGLVASRQLLLANSLYLSTTPDLAAIADEYLDRTVSRLRLWLTTGRFILDPPEP